jgi:peptidoglycan hydrolase-like protein with peptidoglycan-binding domain
MDPGPIDGIMGPKTMAALKAFQKDQKLTESGRLDDQTRDKLGVSR